MPFEFFTCFVVIINLAIKNRNYCRYAPLPRRFDMYIQEKDGAITAHPKLRCLEIPTKRMFRNYSPIPVHDM